MIRNVGLSGGSVSGSYGVGALVGQNYGGSVSNSYATGSVTGSSFDVGGLVGENQNGSTVSNSYQPAACMSHIYSWLGLSRFEINPGKLAVMGPPESDSHYHMKYLHKQSERVAKPEMHNIPPRIQAQIETVCAWYYQTYYPKKAPPSIGRP